MAGYIRQDTVNNIADGNIINASDFDNEYNAIEAAFSSSTGHTHDGTAAEGAPITKIGPTQDVVASASALTPKLTNTVDLGSNALRYKELWLEGAANLNTALTVANGGTGATTLTGYVKGSGTSAFTASASVPVGDITGTLPVANGGTGAATFTANNVLLGNGTSAFQVVAPGSNGNVLTSDGTTWTSAAAPSFSQVYPGAGVAVSTGTAWDTSLTAPTGALVGDTDTQTLTNKTITGLKETKVAIAASDIDLSAGTFFTKTISGATTFTVSNVPSTGTVASFILDLTNGGSATITWWSGVEWPGGTAPTLTSSGRDVLGFFTYDGGTEWNGLVLGKDVK